jgi:hypothetical protein
MDGVIVVWKKQQRLKSLAGTWNVLIGVVYFY